MASKKVPSRIYPQFQTWRSGPWTGMSDNIEPMAGKQDRATLLRNCYALSQGNGIEVVGIPGFTQVGTQQGAPGARVAQWIGQFLTTTGTQKNILVVNGEIVEYSYSGNTFTTRVTAANFVTAGITISASARIYGVMFANTLVLSDGVNLPFTWDGTAGAGGLVRLTNAAVAYGQPVVRAYKLFFIKNSEPSAIIWSEEGTANTGYEAGGYNNAWTLAGPKGERIYALGARNDSLEVIRARSTTTVLGDINTDFRTANTKSAISERIGTSSAGGVIVLDEGTLVVDTDGRPQFWPRGSGYLTDPPLWADCEQTTTYLAKASFSKIEIVADDSTGLIWVGLPGIGQSYPNTFLLYERTGGVPNLAGVAGDFPAQRMGIWLDDSSNPVLVHAGVDDGYIYSHGTPTGTKWDYGFASGSLAITHTVNTSAVAADIDEEKTFEEVTAEGSPPNDIDITWDFQTPYGVSSTPLTMSLVGATGMIWDVDTWDDDSWAGDQADARERIGVHEHGRWLVARGRHAMLGEQFSLSLVKVLGWARGREARVA